MDVIHKIESIGAKLSWPAIWVLIIVLVAFAGVRAFDMFGGVADHGIFERRYLDHPVIVSIHMATGLMFIILAPFQFSKKFRAKNINRHRVLGRTLMVSALFAGIYGIVSAVELPTFGGLSSATSVIFFGPIFLFCVMRSWWSIRNKRITQHREWMIRALAIGLGVGTQRLILVIMQIKGIGMEESFGPSLWLGMGLNLLIAETWINLSREKPESKTK